MEPRLRVPPGHAACAGGEQMTDRRPTTPARVEERLESAFGHIEHPKKRAFLRRYAMTGKKLQSARDAGIHHDTLYSPRWKGDPEFMEALEVARLMAGDVLEEEMIRRGVDGVDRYQFHNKTGEPLLHPEMCRCGHSLSGYHPEDGEGGGGPCAHPDCTCLRFRGAPYVEKEYSDRLLEQLARSHLPERYADRLQVRGLLANIKLEALPDVVLARLAGGEDPYAVLVSVLDRGGPDADAVKRALPAGAVGRVANSAHDLPAPGEIVVDEPPKPSSTLDDDVPDELPAPGSDNSPPGEEGFGEL